MIAPALMNRVTELCKEHGATLEKNAPLARFTSAGVGGAVPAVASPTRADSVAALVSDLRGEGLEVRPLGNGTNLLVDDEGGPWVVLRLGGMSGPMTRDGQRVTAPAGMSLPFLVRETVKAGLRGLEHAEGIPGTVGGSTFGNAGCYGGDMGHVVRRIRLLRDGRDTWIEVESDDFGYRCSPVLDGDVILSVELELAEDEVEAIRRDKAGYRRKRLESQPIGRRSAGCVFKNPEGESAGRLIDLAGLKGSRIGGAAVSEVHANFLINEGNATTRDFLNLIERIQDTVQDRFDVDLETEIQIWFASPEGGES